MDSKRSIEILNRQLEVIKNLEGLTADAPQFQKWQRDTEVAVGRIFSEQSRNYIDFQEIDYTPNIYYTGMPDSEYYRSYSSGLQKARTVLMSILDEVREYGTDDGNSIIVPDNFNLLERICQRFHAVARQLQSRREERPTITIEDEYDVQDLLHAILRLHFDDIRPEEWCPSYAGKSSRLDFLLKSERIVIEVKKTRKSLKESQIGDELIIDRARYEKHPDCDTLICFVYDPEGRIGNPAGLEKDLEKHKGRIKVRVIIAPKN